jgi:hypothetical protein
MRVESAPYSYASEVAGCHFGGASVQVKTWHRQQFRSCRDCYVVLSRRRQSRCEACVKQDDRCMTLLKKTYLPDQPRSCSTTHGATICREERKCKVVLATCWILLRSRSDHLASQISLGHIHRIEDNAELKDARGLGFELRTDGHGAVRAQQGLLLSTEGSSMSRASSRAARRP